LRGKNARLAIYLRIGWQAPAGRQQE
jgi:hypothetical protein